MGDVLPNTGGKMSNEIENARPCLDAPSQPKPCVLLKALLSGATFEQDGFTFGMSEDFNLVVKLHKITGEGETFFWSTIDCSISTFVSMAEKISNEELFLIAAVGALKRKE